MNPGSAQANLDINGHSLESLALVAIGKRLPAKGGETFAVAEIYSGIDADNVVSLPRFGFA